MNSVVWMFLFLLVHDFMTAAGASGGSDTSHTASPLSLIFLDLQNIDLFLNRK